MSCNGLIKFERDILLLLMSLIPPLYTTVFLFFIFKEHISAFKCCKRCSKIGRKVQKDPYEYSDKTPVEKC